MMKNKSDNDMVDIYCYVNVSVVNLGMVGPNKPAKIEKRYANSLIKESPKMWSLKPFENKEDVRKNA